MIYIMSSFIILFIIYGFIKYSITNGDEYVNNPESWDSIVKDWKLLSLINKSNGLELEYYEKVLDSSLDEVILVLIKYINDKYVLECYTRTYESNIVIEGHKHLSSYDYISSEFFDDYIKFKTKILLSGVKNYMNEGDK